MHTVRGCRVRLYKGSETGGMCPAGYRCGYWYGCHGGGHDVASYVCWDFNPPKWLFNVTYSIIILQCNWCHLYNLHHVYMYVLQIMNITAIDIRSNNKKDIGNCLIRVYPYSGLSVVQLCEGISPWTDIITHTASHTSPNDRNKRLLAMYIYIYICNVSRLLCSVCRNMY
jgi:hypothetical protein